MAATEPNVFDFNYKPPISERFQAYNVVHSALKRLSPRLFRFQRNSEYGPVHFTAAFAEYSITVCFGKTLPEDGVIVWDETKKLTPADPESFCVFDHEIMEGHILGDNEVAVSTTYFENAERLVQLDQRCETKYYNERQDKRKALVEAAALKKKDAEEGGSIGADETLPRTLRTLCTIPALVVIVRGRAPHELVHRRSFRDDLIDTPPRHAPSPCVLFLSASILAFRQPPSCPGDVRIMPVHVGCLGRQHHRAYMRDQ
ncbi:hypothetical protein B0H14DRAFT_3439353 [Mycena olivaceomarginata]|nr:hypothetical protein B0H14DRAFT_3439353 [Mycena olivaceomarginata]